MELEVRQIRFEDLARRSSLRSYRIGRGSEAEVERLYSLSRGSGIRRERAEYISCRKINVSRNMRS